jgi:hypothetical protein
MNAAQSTSTQIQGQEPVRKEIGRAGRVALSWAMAGGIGLGGVIVALMTLAGRLSANALMLTTTGLFIIGAFLGFVHGAVLGSFSHDRSQRESDLGRSLAKGALYAIPGLAVSWLAASWISMTVVAQYAGTVTAWSGAIAGWVVGAVVLAWAGAEGVKALRVTYARWPEWQMGTALVALAFAALLMVFLSDRPELWGTRFRVTEVGAVVMAAAAALWVVGPVVTMGLLALRRLRLPNVAQSFATRGLAVDIGLGLAVGAALGLLAVPFFAGTAVPAAASSGTFGAVILSLSYALVDEVLLRVFVLSGMVWLLLSWGRVTRNEAAVIAVIVAAVVESALHLPGILSTGFPGAVSATAYLLTAVMIPGLAFGALYWTRGLRAAVLTHAASALVLTLILL